MTKLTGFETAETSLANISGVLSGMGSEWGTCLPGWHKTEVMIDALIKSFVNLAAFDSHDS